MIKQQQHTTQGISIIDTQVRPPGTLPLLTLVALEHHARNSPPRAFGIYAFATLGSYPKRVDFRDGQSLT